MSKEDKLNRSPNENVASPPGNWLRKLEELSGQKIDVKQLRRTVYLVIDCSGSMGGDKLKQAKLGATGFAEEAFKKGYAVGLIQFSSYAAAIADASVQNASFRAAVEKLFAGGSTNMAAGIELSISKLTDIPGERMICIATDGQPDDREGALRMAHEARKMRIDIMTIGTDDADKAFLEQLATRKELSVKVERQKLQQAITSMAKLLPGDSN